MSDETENERKARKAARAAIKAASTARKKNKYAVQKLITAENKRKTLAKRVRQNPNDLQAKKLYGERYGKS